MKCKVTRTPRSPPQQLLSMRLLQVFVKHVKSNYQNILVKNETKCHGAMLIQRRMDTFTGLPNMVKTGNGEIDFLKGIIDIFTSKPTH